MSLYVPLDVNYADDPKVIEAGPEAELVYVRSLAIAKRIGSDGRIHRAHLFRLAGDLPSIRSGECDTNDFATDLVNAGLWIEVPDGWQIAAWDRWNLTAEELEERKRGKAEGGSLGNHRRWHEARGKVDPDCRYCTGSDTESDDRSHSDSLEGSDTESIRRSESDSDTDSLSLIPKSFELRPEDLAWFRSARPDLDVDRVTDKFVNWAASTKRESANWWAEWRLFVGRER